MHAAMSDRAEGIGGRTGAHLDRAARERNRQASRNQFLGREFAARGHGWSSLLRVLSADGLGADDVIAF